MREWLTSLSARVIEALLAAAVLALGGELLGLGTLSVAVWIMLGGSVVLLSLGYGLANLAQGGRRRSQYYGEHVREAIESMQKGTVGEIPGVTWGVWIERGIMGSGMSLARTPAW